MQLEAVDAQYDAVKRFEYVPKGDDVEVWLIGSRYRVGRYVMKGGKKGEWNKQLNEPLEPNSIYNVDGYLYETDNLGRVKNVKGKLKLKDRGRNQYQQAKSVKIKDGVVGEDDGGHLIAQIFNGPGEQINYLPMDRASNQYGEWRQLEREWQEFLEANSRNSVEVNITPIFDADSSRPISFRVNYKLNGRNKFRNISN